MGCGVHDSNRKAGQDRGAWRCCTKTRRFGLSVRWSGISGHERQRWMVQAGTQHRGISRRVQKRTGLRNLASCVMLLHCFVSLMGMVDCLGVSVCDTNALRLS